MSRDCFISCAHADEELAQGIEAALAARDLVARRFPRDGTPGRSYPAQIVEAIAGSAAVALVLSPNVHRSPHIPREVDRAVHHHVPIFVFRTCAMSPTGDLEYLISLSHWYDGFPPSVSHFEAFSEHIARALLPADEPPLAPTEQERLYALVSHRDRSDGCTRDTGEGTSLHDIVANGDLAALRELAALARRRGEAGVVVALLRLHAAIRDNRWPLGLAQLSLSIGQRDGRPWFQFHAALDGRLETKEFGVDSSSSKTIDIGNQAALTVEVDRTTIRVVVSASPESPLRARRFSIWNGLRLIQSRLVARSTGAFGSEGLDGHIVLLEEAMEMPT